MNNKIIIITLTLVLTLLLVSCSEEEMLQKQLDKVMSEEVIYTTYSNNGFIAEYPDWPDAEHGEELEVSVTKGYCSVVINQEETYPEWWYEALLNSVEESDIIISDQENLRLKTTSPYENFTMISDTRFYECSSSTYAISIVCISQVDEAAQHIHEKVFNSVACEEEEPEEQAYQGFEDDDYIIEYPDWNEFEDESGEERVLAVTQGMCTLLVDKHNALPEDIFNWLEQAIEENDDHDLLESSNKGDIYYIDYELLYGEYTVTAKTELLYCNYMTYITQFLCVNDLVTDEFEEIRETTLDSVDCTGEYEIPTPEIIEEQKEELIEEEPEVMEEIEEEIVQTNVGEEFGIDEEMVVYFINENEFFTKIMKDFSKANLVFEDEDNGRELKLKVIIGDDGKIMFLDDGEYSDADVTLILPLRDAINIFNNAANINPITLIGFAVNLRTEPPEVKDEVIKNVLTGKYN